MSQELENIWSAEAVIKVEAEERDAKVQRLEEILKEWKIEHKGKQRDNKLRKEFGIIKRVTVVLEDIAYRKSFQPISGTKPLVTPITKSKNKFPVHQGRKQICGTSVSAMLKEINSVKANKILKKFYCKECDYPCASERTFKMHKQAYHPKLHPCLLCGKNFLSRLIILDHYKRLHPGQFKKCSDCPAWVKTSEYSTHGNASPLKCPADGCGKIFYCRKKRDRHMKSHRGLVFAENHPNKFFCEDCDDNVSSESSEVHRKLYHSAGLKKEHHCSICTKSFITNLFLKSHYRLVHPGETKKCPYCFTHYQKSQLATHRNAPALKCPQKDCERIYYCVKLFENHKKGHSLPYSCETCGQKFSENGNMKNHVKLVHGDERRFFCKCGKGFWFRKELLRHEEVHEERPVLQCNLCKAKFHSELKFQAHKKRHEDTQNTYHTCEICSKNVRGDNWKRHAYLHFGRYKYTCDVCEFQFKLKQTLVTHMLTHFPQPKRFKCDLCSFKAYRKCEIKNHLVFHNSKRNFMCAHCPATYKTRGCVQRHIKNSHEGKDVRVISSKAKKS